MTIRQALTPAVEDAGGPRAPDLAADCGRLGAAAGHPSGGRPAGLSPRRGHRAGLADGVTGGVPAGQGAGAGRHGADRA